MGRIIPDDGMPDAINQRLVLDTEIEAGQLPRLNRILALRDLGFSLEQIAGYFDISPPYRA